MNRIIFTPVEDERKNAIVGTLLEEAQLWLDFNGYNLGTIHIEDMLEELEDQEVSRPLSIVKTKVEEALLWLGLPIGEVVEPRVKAIVKTHKERIRLWVSTL